MRAAGIAAAIVALLAGLTSTTALAQSQPIDWSLADSPITANDTPYTGMVGSVTWTLTITASNEVIVQPGDSELLRGSIGSNTVATYALSFDQPVLLTWSNDFFEPNLGGLANSEFVDILGGVGTFDLVDNSPNVDGLDSADSLSPVISVVGGTDRRASWNTGGEHAYYLANSVGHQSALTWTHTSTQSKREGWRVDVAECHLVDWSVVAGNGAYAGSVGGVGWSLTISGADAAGPQSGDSTLLRAVIGGPSDSATYALVFDEPVHIVWWNDTSASVGGLAGLDLLSNEFVDLIGGDGVFDLFDNSANIPALPGASSVSPVFSTLGSDLRAESSPGVDHAYYLAQSLSPETSLTWTHNNAVTKAEVWRVCVVPEPPPVPALSAPGLVLLILVVSGGTAWAFAPKRGNRVA